MKSYSLKFGDRVRIANYNNELWETAQLYAIALEFGDIKSIKVDCSTFSYFWNLMASRLKSFARSLVVAYVKSWKLHHAKPKMFFLNFAEK